MKSYLFTYSNNRNDSIDQWLVQAKDPQQAEAMFWQYHDRTIFEIDDCEEDQ